MDDDIFSYIMGPMATEIGGSSRTAVCEWPNTPAVWCWLRPAPEGGKR